MAARSEPLRLYLSASIVNAPLNLRLRDHLPAARFDLVLPQEFAPVGLAHPRFPRAIYERCIEEMERCEAGLLLLDSFGIDCASEAGWLAARGKPLIGLASGSVRFLQNWMVKGNLAAVVCLDPLIFDEVGRDPILRDCAIRLCAGWEGLGAAIEDVLLGAAARASAGASKSTSKRRSA